MRIVNELYQDVEEILNRLVYYTITDLRELKDPERESLTEAYDLLVQTLACLHQSAFYRRHEEEDEEEEQVCVSENPNPFWSRDDIDFSKVRSYYTCEQKGEEVPEGTPIDNSNHTYFMGDERKFNWDIANAITHLTRSNTVNYDDFKVIVAGREIKIWRKSKNDL